MAVVLIVDDEPQIRQLLGTLVQREGHTVLSAADAKEAWTQLEKKPDVVLLDVDMPGETGVELLLRMRREKRCDEVPVVFVTAFPERSMPVQLTGRGAVKVIPKPFRAEQITSTLKTLLNP